MRTFTVGFADARYDERAYARAVAERYGTVHEELELEAEIAETLPRLAAAFDEPFGDEAALPTFLVCEAARRHVTVALVGDGGDEAFAGLRALPPHALAGAGARVRRPRSPPLRCAGFPLRSGSRARPLFRAARFLDVAAAPAARALRAADGGLPARAPARALDGPGTRAACCTLDPDGSGVAALQLLDIETYLPGDLLLKADIASMAHSLELRSPFLDHDVVELGLALPTR